MTSDTSILLVLQPKLLRLALRHALAAELRVDEIVDAGTGMEALSIMASEQPRLAIVDPLVPGGGANLVRALRLSNPRTSVLAICRPRDRDSVVAYLQAGVSAFVDPDSSLEEIGHSFRRVIAGETVIGARISALLSGAGSMSAAVRTTDLSKRELEVIREVALGKSNQEVALNLGISEYTVKGHLVNVFSKLQLTNRVQLTTFALENGLAETAEPSNRVRVVG
jgi:NarL family two-component system response regulator LiaR